MNPLPEEAGLVWLNSAVNCIKQGWYVLPLIPKGKRPLLEHGFKGAVNDRIQLYHWSKKWPKANVGAVTGERSGIVVLDIDDRNDGFDNLSHLEDKYGKLPETVQSVTGSSGTHFFFKYKQGMRSRINVVPGVDFKADGGYVVVPPSVHPNGNSILLAIPTRRVRS